MAALDRLGGDTESGDEHGGATLDEQVDVSEHVAGHGGEQVDAERARGQCSGGSDLLDHLVLGHRRGAEAAVASRLGDRCGERAVRDAAHAGEHDRVLNAEQFGQTCLHRCLLENASLGR